MSSGGEPTYKIGEGQVRVTPLVDIREIARLREEVEELKATVKLLVAWHERPRPLFK